MQAYLLVLEIDPAENNHVYANLPLHCTLVNWFWTDTPTELLIDSLESVIVKHLPVILEAQGIEAFTGFTKNGTVPVQVNTIKPTQNIVNLHNEICQKLDALSCRYMRPQFIKEGYRPHVTHHNDRTLPEGSVMQCTAAYLAAADAPEYGNNRTILHHFTS